MPSLDLSVLMCSRVGCAGRPVAKHGDDSLCSVDLLGLLVDDPKAALSPIVLPRLRVDPSEVLTPDDVETELRNLLNRQHDGTLFLKAHRERHSEVETNYLLTKAAALAASEHRNEKQRDAEALLACAALYRESRAEDLIVKTTLDQLHEIHYEIETWRSIGASIRSSIENAGRGGGAY